MNAAFSCSYEDLPPCLPVTVRVSADVNGEGVLRVCLRGFATATPEPPPPREDCAQQQISWLQEDDMQGEHVFAEPGAAEGGR